MSTTHLTDEQRVCKVLEELRHRTTPNDEVDRDISTLQKVLHDPVFRQITSDQSGSVSPSSKQKPTNTTTSSEVRSPKKRRVSATNNTENERIEQIRSTITPRLQHLLTKTSKLIFADVNTKEVRPVVIETEEENRQLLVIAPSDIKAKSGGKIRVADRIVAIDEQLLVARRDQKSADFCNIDEAAPGAIQSTSEICADQDDEITNNNNNNKSLISIFESKLQQCESCNRNVVLTVLRQSTPMVLSGDWTQVQIIRLRNEPGSGLGFGIVGGTSTGVVVKTILPGSPADKDKRLKAGDHILRIGEMSVHGMTSQQVANVLRQQSLDVQLVVGRPWPHDLGSGASSRDSPDCWKMATRAALCPKSLEDEIVLRARERAQPEQGSNASREPAGSTALRAAEEEEPTTTTIAVENRSAVSGGGERSECNGNGRRKTSGQSEDYGIFPSGTHPEMTPSTSSAAAAQNQPSEASCSSSKSPQKQQTQRNQEDNDNKISNSLESPMESTASKVPLSLLCSSSSNNGPETKTQQDEQKPQYTLRQLQEMALTVFARAKWVEGEYETVEVVLTRDPVLGLGITVAGYVHKKEEINGVFVKSLVPNSSAHYSRRIKLHDLIIEVNGESLESLSHAESVRKLVGCGTRVNLKLVRFKVGSAQAACLNMLQEQESASEVMDVAAASKHTHTCTHTQQAHSETAHRRRPPQSILIKRDVVSEWKKRLGSEYEIISVDLLVVAQANLDSSNSLATDGKQTTMSSKTYQTTSAEGGVLGISLEGTVDVLNGTQLCPHHYIESLRAGGPAANSNVLRSGDELLQVNEVVLYGESHVTVRQALSKAALYSNRVRLTVARKAHTVNVFVPRPEQSLPLAYSLLAAAASDDRLVKAKSETCLPTVRDQTAAILEQVSERLRSRSLQPLSGLAIWKCVPMIVYLEKDSKGLGFSVIDYQDPLHPGESVIVIRSLVPGGQAQADGRIVPGDRLMFVNDEDLSNCSLDYAVNVLKSTPKGLVRLGIAKPVPIDQCTLSAHSPIISPYERVLAKGSSPTSRRRPKKQLISSYGSSQEEVWIGAQEYRRLHPQSYYPSPRSISPASSTTPHTPHTATSLNSSHQSMISWSPCSTRSISPSCASPLQLRGSWAYDVIYLPGNLERAIKIMKGPLALGLVLDAEADKGVNGCVVKSVCSRKAVAQDGRIQVGDYIVKINNEGMRNITNSQARAILKRTNLIGTQCNVVYITSSDAKLWKERFHHADSEAQSPVINRLSPKVFPKFYRSPFLERRQTGQQPRAAAEGDRQEAGPSVESGRSDVESPPPQRVTYTGETASTDFDDDGPDRATTGSVQQVSKYVVTREEAEPTRTSGCGLDDSQKFVDDSQELVVARDDDECALREFASELVELVLEDAYLELLVAVSTPDWIGRPPIPKNLDFDKIEQRESTADEEGASEAEEREESSCPQLDKEIDELVSQAVIHTKNGLAENFEEVARSEKEISPEVVTSSPKEGEKAQLERGDSREGDECGECKQQETRSERNKDNDEDRESDLPMATPTATPPPAGADIKAATEQKRQCSQEQQQPKQQEASPEQPKIVPMGRSKFWGEARTVILNREPNQSFGISIVGGRVEVSQRGGLPGTGNTVSGIFIKSVLPNSPAGRSGLMNMGDRVISVNEHDLRDSTHDQAVYLIKNASNPVRFVVQSLHSFSPQQMVTFGVAPSTSPSSILKKPESVIPSRASAEDSWRSIPEKEEGDEKNSTKDANKPQGSKEEQSDPEIERDEPHKQTEGGEKTIDRNKAAKVGIEPGSAAYLERSQSDSEPEDAFLYTKDKISRKYGDLGGDKILLRLENVPPGGLGLSLAGNRDRDKTSVFVVALKSTCPLPIKVGDELLEVNGRVLLGLSHLNASARIRECCEEGMLELLLLRRFDALEQMAIRPEPMLSRSRTSPACDQDSASLVETTLIPGRRRQPGEPTREDDGGEEEDDDRDSEEKQQNGGGSAGTEESAGIEETKKESSEVAETKEESLSRASSSSCNASREAKETTSSEVTPPKNLVQSVSVADEAENSTSKAEEQTMTGAKNIQTAESTSTGGALQTVENVRKKSSTQLERTVGIETGRETLIEIDKDGKGLGLSIVGGSDTVLGTVVIHEVYPDGAAAMDGRLKPGDQVLEVNGVSLRGVSHEHAISLLRRTPAKVRLLIYRDVNLQLSLLDPTQIYNIFEMELTKKPGRGLGLSIVGRKNEPGVYVSEVVKGGAAEADARLMQGDQILAVNGQDVTNSMQEDVAAMLKTCTGRVALRVGRWKLTETANRVHAAAEAAYASSERLAKGTSTDNININNDRINNNINNNQDESMQCSGTFALQSAGAGHEEPKQVPPPPAPSRPTAVVPQVTVEGGVAEACHHSPNLIHSDLSPVTEEPSSGGDQKSLTADEEPYSSSTASSGTVTAKPASGPSSSSKEIHLLEELFEENSDSMLIELKKVPDQQLGMGIGKRNRGILVTSLQPGSIAAEKLKVADRLMAVNGLPVTDQLSAVTLVKASGERLCLQIARPRNVPTA